MNEIVTGCAPTLLTGGLSKETHDPANAAKALKANPCVKSSEMVIVPVLVAFEKLMTSV